MQRVEKKEAGESRVRKVTFRVLSDGRLRTSNGKLSAAKGLGGAPSCCCGCCCLCSVTVTSETGVNPRS